MCCEHQCRVSCHFGSLLETGVTFVSGLHLWVFLRHSVIDFTFPSSTGLVRYRWACQYFGHIIPEVRVSPHMFGREVVSFAKFWSQQKFFMLIFNSYSYLPSSPSAHPLSTILTTDVTKIDLTINQLTMAWVIEKSWVRHIIIIKIRT